MAGFGHQLAYAAVATLVLTFSASAIAEDQPQPRPISKTPHVPPLRLDAPRWLPLTGTQIVALFSDRVLEVEENYEPSPGVKVEMVEVGGCWPQEKFFADGRWQRVECQRGARTFEGHWGTDKFRGGERLCVEAADFPKRCRFVWEGASADRVFMGVAGVTRASDSWDDPASYAAYRLTERYWPGAGLPLPLGEEGARSAQPSGKVRAGIKE